MESVPGDDFDPELENLSHDEGAIRGWIPPDDRLWLHPSEMGRASRMQDLDGARRRAKRSDRRGLFAAGVVGTAALTAAVAAVALAASSSSPLSSRSPFLDSPTHITNSVTNSTLSSDVQDTAQLCSVSMPSQTCKVIERIESSVLKIVVKNGQGETDGTAVVVPAGGETVAITAASLVGDAASVEGFDSSGTGHKLKVLGVNSASGVAVIKIPWSMPAASIAQQTLFAGQYLLLTCDESSSNAPTPTVGQVDNPDTSAPNLMDVIDVDVTERATPGGVLLDSQGDVLGLLAATSSDSDDLIGEFVPAWFAVGVAQKIAAERRLVHGWLDVVGTNPDNGQEGALVVSESPHGAAAAAGIKPGDVVIGMITAGGMAPILSMSDLEGRLYLEPPGAKVELQVLRGGQDLKLAPVLAASVP
jgi:S1-C subfamily serine protease